MKILFAFFTAVLSVVATAAQNDEPITVRDATQIGKIVSSIPSEDKSMPYKMLSDRLPNLGLSVEKMIYGVVSNDEVKSSGGQYKRGDVLYQFFTNEPNPAARISCPIAAMFSLVKRGSRWIPQDRTSNFLVRGYEHCKAPDDA